MQKGTLPSLDDSEQKRKIPLNFWIRILISLNKIFDTITPKTVEFSELLRNTVLFFFGLSLFIIGAFNLHNNFLILSFIGITILIFSVSLLNKDMEKNDTIRQTKPTFSSFEKNK